MGMFIGSGPRRIRSRAYLPFGFGPARRDREHSGASFLTLALRSCMARPARDKVVFCRFTRLWGHIFPRSILTPVPGVPLCTSSCGIRAFQKSRIEGFMALVPLPGLGRRPNLRPEITLVTQIKRLVSRLEAHPRPFADIIRYDAHRLNG
jgi:hypothetical protein